MIADRGLPKAPKGANKQMKAGSGGPFNPAPKHKPDMQAYRAGRTKGGTSYGN